MEPERPPRVLIGKPMLANPRLRHLPWVTMSASLLALVGLVLWFAFAAPFASGVGLFRPFLIAAAVPLLGLLIDWWRLRRPSRSGLAWVLLGGLAAVGLAVGAALWANALGESWPAASLLLLFGAPGALILAFGALAPRLLRAGRLPPLSLLWGTVQREQDESLLVRTDEGAWLSLPRELSIDLFEEPLTDLSQGHRLALVGLFRRSKAEVSPFRDEERIEALRLWMVDGSVEALSRRFLSGGLRIAAFLSLAGLVAFVFASLGAFNAL